MLLFCQLKGRAKDLIEIIKLQDFEKGDVLDRIWQIYDDAFEKMAQQRLDDVHTEWEQAYRKPGQSMQYWCVYLRKVRLELQAKDPESTLSDKALASKMLRGSGLTKEAQAQVLWNCCGTYDSQRIETALRVTYKGVQDNVRRITKLVAERQKEPRGRKRGDERYIGQDEKENKKDEPSTRG